MVMALQSLPMNGTFAWYDLMTPDPAASKKFYTSVAGWGTQPFDKQYEMWTASGQPIGGIAPINAEQRAAGIPPHWLAYVNVDDVDASANKVRSLGGNVMHGPEDIPNVGRYAIIQDPQGAVLAIFRSSNQMMGWDGTPSVGKITWHELMAVDGHRALEFYRQLFGWQLIEEADMGPAGKYLEYGKNGKMYGGIFNRRPEHGGMQPNWTFYINVRDLDKAVAATKKGGGAIVMGPMEVPGGDTVAIAKDPQGAMFALHKSKSAGTPMLSATDKPRKTAAKKKSAAKPRRQAVSRKTARKTAKKSGRKAAARRAKPRPKAKKRSKRR